MTEKPTRSAIVHQRERVFDGFFKIDRAVVSYADEHGANERVTLEVFERGDSAAAVLHHRERGEIILTEQFRYPTYEKGPGWMVELVAGSINAGETAEDCIRREIREELGYEIAELEFIARFYMSPGGTSERIWLFYCVVTDDDLRDASAQGVAAHNERVARLAWSEAQFFEAIDSAEIQDAKTIIGAQWLRRKLAADLAAGLRSF